MSENIEKTSENSLENNDRKYSLTESISSNTRRTKPLFRNFVNRLQIASRLARSQRNSFEEENDVVADDQEIKHFSRLSSKLSSKKTKRPKTLTLRQFSQLSQSSGNNSKNFNRNESKISEFSANSEEEYENGIISDGIIHFWRQFAFDEGHPFLRVTTNVDIEVVSKVMHKCWDLEVPKIVTFIVSNKCHSTNWINERQIKNFQKGLIDAAISTNMWIFTNGVNSGIANLIGNAIKTETYKMRIKRTLKTRNLTNLIGVVTEEDIRYGELLGASNKEHINIENEGISYGDQFELNANHTHFIVIRDKQKNNNSVEDFTLKVIQLLTRECQKQSTERGLKCFENKSNLTVYLTVTSTPDSLDTDFSIESTEVPVVSIVIEGDRETVKLVVDLIKRHIPVVVLRGSGGIADLIAFAYLEIIHRCPGLHSWDLEFIDQYLKPMLTKKIISYFHDLRDNTLTRNLLRDRIIECVRLSRTEEREYLTVLNMHNSSSCNLENLSQHLLLALLKSRKTNERLSTENFLKDLELTMDWNCAQVAKDVIFGVNTNNIFKLDKNIFESALIRPNREEFIELFLSLGFQLHKFVSPLRLNRLFKLIHDNEFYRTHCWESILGRASSVRQPKYFIDNDLNWLIEICTGLENFVNSEHLHLNVMGLYPNNSSSAERKALTLLTIWAVMQNRDKLAKVFWKHSDQPVHLALVISMLFDRLSWYAADNNMKSDLKDKSKQFADFANGVLDVCYNEDICRANNVLNQSIHDWNYKTAVDIAANAQLRQFLAHPCCQKFLTNTFLGNIRLREINWGIITIPPSIKILLCAFFVFPLFVWVRFKSNELEIPENEVKEDEEFEDIYSDIYCEDNISASIITETTGDSLKVGYINPMFTKTVTNNYDALKNRGKTHYNNYIRDKMFAVKQPPLGQMMVMFFSAPITKFYMSQLFYLLYLPLLSLAVIYPSCGYWELDVLVCFWTSILCIDYIRRTYILIKKYASIPVFLKCLEISSIIIFIILFAITRVFRIHVISPYKQKLILSVGVLYFYYRLIGIYLPISPTLGPLLHRLKLMITVDFVNYMRIALLVILSNMVVMQAILYPDSELSIEMFHKAFHRAFFSLFLTPVIELETNDLCESHMMYDNSGDQCLITGKYNSTSCANSGVWAYAFFIQYFIFLKLILSTLLMAIFAATASKLQTETDNIWKFQRYLLVIDFANRLPLPAPLSVFHYIYFIFKYFQNLFCNISSCCDNTKNNKVVISNPNELQEKHKLTAEECTYWRQLASDYINELEAKAAEEEIPIKEWEYIQLISEDMEYEKKILREIKGKVSELERIIFCQHFSSNNHMSAQESNIDCLKTSLSRYSPYPGTAIIRFPLSEKYIPWEVLHIDYEPMAYSKPWTEFSMEMKIFVDEDIIQLKEIKTRKNAIKLKIPEFVWNSNEKSENGQTVNRISWQINGDGSPFRYKLEDNFLPLNPFGRTGLRGRGGFPRWGPNHYVIFVITRWQRRSNDSKNKNLELIIEQLENKDKNYLPERFVSGEDLFGGMKRHFKIDPKIYWVLPEVVNFFKSMCLSQDSNGFEFKLIRNGYIDDTMNTDNAWKEAKVWHIHYDCREGLKKRLVDSSLGWRLLSDSLFSKMPLSHSHIIKSIIDALKADII